MQERSAEALESRLCSGLHLPSDIDVGLAIGRKVGDLVMYDNRAALHRARPYKITEHPRILHRTTVIGEGPTVAD